MDEINIIKYLKMNVECRRRNKIKPSPEFLYLCMEDLILCEGRHFPFKFKKRKWLKRGECFYNAAITAVTEGLIYCEGYAMGVFPVLHAWNYNPLTGEVIDRTWDERTTSRKREYFGIPFKTEYVAATVLRHEASLSLIDNWKDSWPLLRGVEDFKY